MRRLYLKVITRARKEAIQKIDENNYRIKISCPPEKGKANKRIIELIAKELGVRKRDIEIVSGGAANRKTLAVRP